MGKTDSAYIGGQDPMKEEFLSNRRREASRIPPAGAVSAPVAVDGETVTVPVNVARIALNNHMAMLSGRIAAEIHDPYKFMGNGPYLEQMRAQWQVMNEAAIADRERAREELARLGKLTDTEIVDWAVSCGKIGRDHLANWVVM